MGEPKIILVDLETLPDLKEVMKVLPGMSAYPGLTLKASINSIICCGYKIYGEGKTHVINAWDNKKLWSKDVNDDSWICKEILKILTTADCLVTHNGKRFDLKFLQTRLIKHGLNPLPKIMHVDTCSEAKKHLMLFNNRLDTLAKFMTSEQKLENGGWDLWVKVMNRDKKSMATMTEYCAQDVITLEAVFKRLKPFVTQIPNYNFYREHDKKVCANCGSTRLTKNGIRVNRTNKKQRLVCQDCGTNLYLISEYHDPRVL